MLYIYTFLASQSKKNWPIIDTDNYQTWFDTKLCHLKKIVDNMQYCETNEAFGQSHDSYSTVLDPIIMNK